MADIKKEQERDELHRAIWAIADELRGSVDVAHMARYVPYEQIVEQDYNLSVSTYVEPEDMHEMIDIVKLNAAIAEIVKREEKLRAEIDKIIA